MKDVNMTAIINLYIINYVAYNLSCNFLKDFIYPLNKLMVFSGPIRQN